MFYILAFISIIYKLYTHTFTLIFGVAIIVSFFGNLLANFTTGLITNLIFSDFVFIIKLKKKHLMLNNVNKFFITKILMAILNLIIACVIWFVITLFISKYYTISLIIGLFIGTFECLTKTFYYKKMFKEAFFIDYSAYIVNIESAREIIGLEK